MMTQKLFIIILSLLVTVPVFAQTTRRERNLIKEGNECYNKKDYNKAESAYSKAIEFNPNSTIAKFNLGTTLAKKRKSGKDASKQDSVMTDRIKGLFEAVGNDTSADKTLRAHSYYGLGRLAYENEDYAASVEYFKKSLRVNPNDDEARKNLRMAQKKLQQNQNQQQKQNKDNREDNKKQKDEQQPPQHQPQAPKQQQQQTNTDQLLNAMQNQEKNTRDKVNRRKAQKLEGAGRTNKPW